MQEPYPLYVDEISPDEIKATVSNADSYFANLRVLEFLIPRPEPFLGLVRLYRSYVGEKIAKKLGHVDLRDRFMEVYEDILNHPENHRKCKWIVGKAKGFFGREYPRR